MLVQLTALLSLGVLCSSAPLQPSTPSPPEESYRSFIGFTIQELLHDMKKLPLNGVPSVEVVNVTVERCTHSHLNTFVAALEALDKPMAVKLKLVKTCKSMILKDLDEVCTTVQVTSDVFLKTLETFLRFLYEKSQDA